MNSENKDSSNIDIVTGDPKKAINKLAIPMIASILFMMIYNIVDSIWVSGLGAEPLAALGFLTPVFIILVGLGNGLGAGVNSLIARHIGAKNFKDAGNAAIHSIILSIIVSIIIPIILAIILKPLLSLMGADSVMNYSLEYGYPLIICGFATMMPGIFAGIFRAEGAVKRATYPMILTALLNIVLDPIFIYPMKMGIGGAAWATVLASVIGLLVMLYWIFVKKDTYLHIELKEYKRSLKIYKDILVVGFPASLEQLIMSVLGIVMNSLLAIVAGTTAVAAYTAAWRLVSIGITPAIGIGLSAITVAGAAYGAKDWKKLNITCNYSVKVGLIASIIVAAIFFIFAGDIAYIFSYSSSSANLSPIIANALRVLCFFLLGVPLGVTAANIFQGVGKGTTSLILTTLRELVLVSIFASVFGIIFNWGEIGVYCGMVIGGAIGSVIAFVYVKIYLKRLKKVFEK